MVWILKVLSVIILTVIDKFGIQVHSQYSNIFVNIDIFKFVTSLKSRMIIHVPWVLLQNFVAFLSRSRIQEILGQNFDEVKFVIVPQWSEMDHQSEAEYVPHLISFILT